MKKRILSMLMSVIMVASILVGCENKEGIATEEVVEELENVPSPTEEPVSTESPKPEEISVVEEVEDVVEYTYVEVKEGEYDYLIQEPNRGHAVNQPATYANFGMNIPQGWEILQASTMDFEDKEIYDAILLIRNDYNAYLYVSTVDTYVMDCDYDNIYEEGALFQTAGLSNAIFYIKEVEQQEKVTTKYGETQIYSYVLERSVDGQEIDAEVAMFYVNDGRVLLTYMNNNYENGLTGYVGILKELLEEIF